MARDGPDITEAIFIILLCIAFQKVMCSKRMTCDYVTAYKNNHTFRYPKNATYVSGDRKCWLFVAPPPYKVLKIEFKKFMLEKNPDCSHDSLTVFDGKDNDPKDLIGKFCGSLSDIQKVIVSDDEHLYLEFRSDGTLNREGFEFEYKAGYEGDFKSSSKDDDDDYDRKGKKHSLTTVIVGAIIGGLVLITGIVVFICVCASSRRCTCRSGSSSDRRDSIGNQGSGHRRIHTALSRTDRVCPGDVPNMPQVENPIPVFPSDFFLPSYSEPSAPPPYNGFDAVQRLPSSPPPPYTPRDPNPLCVSLGDINMPHVPGDATSRF